MNTPNSSRGYFVVWSHLVFHYLHSGFCCQASKFRTKLEGTTLESRRSAASLELPLLSPPPTKSTAVHNRSFLKSNRLKAIPEYKKKYKVDPVCVLESDWMSDTISAPDTDDEEKKTAHRRRLVQAARLNPSQQDDPVWERLHPAFQSTELSDIKDELDTIRAAAKKKPKKRPRPSVPRVDLGQTHDHLPTGTVWPFMVSQDWYDTNIDGHEDLEDEMRMYETDPVGFGTNL
ncbi:hypothetical protein B0H17DRAFT_1134008 [Mycena rosella]|uniref:Uncharacterized protein n=1 Tax=Mycena rosella TaxID=1033263 RepID=A0AAD7GEP1_MYCRO|nr:hypothetical protein B0H17DRAFT_1134008 [Mycena rosella]